MESKWEKVRLGDVGKIVTGKTPKTSNEENYGGNIPFLTPSDNMNCKFSCKTKKTLTEKGLSEVRNCLIPKNSICVSCIGSDLGKVIICTEDIVTNQQINSIIVDDTYDWNFIYYSLLILGKHLNYISKSSTAIPIVNKSSFSDYCISIPPLKEQKRIAAILSAFDDKITLNQEMNKTLEAMAQALFKSWFVDFEPFGGVMPSDWREGTLGDVAELNAGGDKPEVFSLTKTEQCTVPIFSNGISNDGLYGYTDVAKIEDESVTVSARGTIGYPCLRSEPYVPIVRLISLTPKKDVMSAKYLYLYLLTVNIQGYGTTQQQLTLPTFKKYAIHIPPCSIVNNFTEIVNPIFAQIWNNQNDNTSLSQLRDALLPKLINGEILLKGGTT